MLKHGCDYSVVGQLGIIGVERKSYGDYVRCIGKDWPRFQKQIAKLQRNKYHCVIVEGSIGDYIWSGSRVTTGSVIAMTAEVVSMGVPVLFAKNRRQAQQLCVWFLEKSLRRMRETSD